MRTKVTKIKNDEVPALVVLLSEGEESISNK
jgi:hypothetical protein